MMHAQLCLALCFGIATLASGDVTCKAGDSSCYPLAQKVTGVEKHYWPMAMGHPHYYSNPPWPGPTDLKASFKWKWFGPNNKRYEEAFVGAVIDDKKNIYVNGHHAIYKLSPNGALIWSTRLPGGQGSAAFGPVIYDGKINSCTFDGLIFALDMETGLEQWGTRAYTSNGGEYSGLAAHKGVVLSKGVQGVQKCQTVPFPSCSGNVVKAHNATNGAELWSYEPNDGILWDWFPQFPDDESAIFMTSTGALVRIGLQTGKLIWQTKGTPNTWTDGSQFVAANGLTYTVEVSSTKCQPHKKGHVNECEGYVTAIKTSDGSQAWRVTVPKPPNTSPVVGRLGKDDKLSLVMGIGQQSQEGCNSPASGVYQFLKGFFSVIATPVFYLSHTLGVWLGDSNTIIWGTMSRTHDVYVFDAKTGKQEWTWSGATTHRKMNPGDEDGFIPRMVAGIRTVCCPTPWGQPRIGTDGTIYIANENGDLYSLRDANGDKAIDNEKEVQIFQTGATFPHCGTAHAPGMMVAVNFDGVFTWRF